MCCILIWIDAPTLFSGAFGEDSLVCRAFQLLHLLIKIFVEIFALENTAIRLPDLVAIEINEKYPYIIE